MSLRKKVLILILTLTLLSSKETGMAQPPINTSTSQWTQKVYDFNDPADFKEALSKGYLAYGDKAISKVNQLISQKAMGSPGYEMSNALSDKEKVLIKHEGFSSVPYIDTAGVETIGIGQTGKYKTPGDILSGFRQAVKDKEVDALTQFGDSYVNAPSQTQGALLSLVYRGDTVYDKNSKRAGQIMNWVGKYNKAVQSGNQKDMDDAYNEFWNHGEYNRELKNPTGVLARIRENSQILFGKSK